MIACTAMKMVNMPFMFFHSSRINDPGFRDRMVDEVLSAAMLYLKGK
jgi:hypothetical protein